MSTFDVPRSAVYGRPRVPTEIVGHTNSHGTAMYYLFDTDAEREAKYRRAIASQATPRDPVAEALRLDLDYLTGIDALLAGPWPGVALATAQSEMGRGVGVRRVR